MIWGRAWRARKAGIEARRRDAESLYARILDQARRPVFYARLGVPDTVDGRFEMVALHVVLVFLRLKETGAEAKALSQALFDQMFADMDRNLRDMGVGDLKVGKHVRRMTEALNGRLRVYGRGLALAGDAALEEALRRNLYGTVSVPEDCLTDMVAYMRREAADLGRRPAVEILAGELEFGPPPRSG